MAGFETLTPKVLVYNNEEGGNEKTLLIALKKLHDWVSGPNRDLTIVEKKGYIVPLLNLLSCNNDQILELVVKILKIISLKETLNESLRSLDTILKLDTLLETSFNSLVLSDACTATETLRRCAPNSVRKVGLGKYENGIFQWLLDFKQLSFQEVGVAWKVWDAGIGFSRWIVENRNIFEGKKILEVGAGLGIAGITVALFGKILMTDYTPKLLNTLKENVTINGNRYPAIKANSTIKSLDWLTEEVPEPLTYDVVIGAEVVYDVNLVLPLAKILHQALIPKGVFYGVSASVRQGIPEFLACMKEIGFTVKVKEFPKHLLPDSKLEYGSNDCLFFVCTKNEDEKDGKEQNGNEKDGDEKQSEEETVEKEGENKEDKEK